MTSIIPEIEVPSTRDVLAAASVGDIITALHVDHSEVITRKPMEFFPVWSAQALANGEVHHGTGGSLHEALVECGVHAGFTATRVRELAEPSPVERVLETLAALAVSGWERGSTKSGFRTALRAALLATRGLPAADAVDMADHDCFGEALDWASARADELIKAAERAAWAREQVEVEDCESVAVAS